jgi:hypothetical protein
VCVRHGREIARCGLVSEGGERGGKGVQREEEEEEEEEGKGEDKGGRGMVVGMQAVYEELKPTMARHFPFELDTFQKEAVVHLERVGRPPNFFPLLHRTSSPANAFGPV